MQVERKYIFLKVSEVGMCAFHIHYFFFTIIILISSSYMCNMCLFVVALENIPMIYFCYLLFRFFDSESSYDERSSSLKCTVFIRLKASSNARIYVINTYKTKP